MANNRDLVSADQVFAATCYVAVTLFFGIWLIWDVSYVRLATFELTTDYWAYAAALNEWMTNFPAPGNPHLLDAAGSPLYMPWFWLLTVTGLYFGIDAIGLMSIAAVLNYILICVGLFLFFRSYFREPWAPLIGFVVAFMFWGIALPWDNVLQLRSFFLTASYPSTFVFGLGLISFWLVLKALRGDYSLLVLTLALFLLVPVILLGHLVTGLFVLATCLLLVFTEAAGQSGKRVLIALTLLSGAAASVFWPHVSILELVRVMLDTGPERWFNADQTLGTMQRFNSATWQFVAGSPKLILVMLGPALLGVCIWLWLLVRRQQMFIALGPLMLALPSILSLVIDIPFAYQFIIFACYFFQLALVWGVLQLFDASRVIPPPPAARIGLAAAVLLMIVMVVFNIALLVVEYSGQRVLTEPVKLISKAERLPDEMNGAELFTALTRSIEVDSVVLATAHAGWPLPAFRGKVLSLHQENPLVRNQNERYAATTAFFYMKTSDQQRSNIVWNYDASNVLVDQADIYLDASLSDWLAEHAVVVARQGSFAMYDIAEATLGQRPVAPEPQAEPAEEEIDTAFDSIAPVVQPDQPVASSVSEPVTSVPVAQPSEESSEEITPVTQDEPEADAKSYGAPISKPILDPEKHGG